MKKYLIVTKQGFTSIIEATNVIEAAQLSGFITNHIVLATIIESNFKPEENTKFTFNTPETEM